MTLVLAFARHTGLRLVEVGYLLIVFAGIWLAAAQVPKFKFAIARTVVAGLALALGALRPALGACRPLRRETSADRRVCVIKTDADVPAARTPTPRAETYRRHFVGNAAARYTG